MRAAITKLLAAAAFLIVLACAISQTTHEGWLTAWFVLFIFVGLPGLILLWMDLGSVLRNADNPTYLKKVLGVVLGVPQAVLGVTSIGIGVLIAGWVLYNSFVATQPEYSGGFLTFGVGPALVVFGAYWVRSAFRRESKAE